MARSKAQQRVLHPQIESNYETQMKRQLPHLPQMSPTTLPANPALVQLRSGEKCEISRQSGSYSSQVIDLTLDDGEEEEDEPMGAQKSGIATDLTTTAVTVSSAPLDTSGACNLGGIFNNNVAAAHSSLRTSNMVVPMVEDAESDVDEDWPDAPSSLSSSMPGSVPVTVQQPAPISACQSVPLSTPALMNEENDQNQTPKDVKEALDTISKEILFSQHSQEIYSADTHIQTEMTNQQTSTSLVDDTNNGITDVEEISSNQARKSGQDTADLPYQITQADNLEDGEIFEEGVAPMPAMPIGMRGRGHLPSSNTTGFPFHQRNKKHKKRGKKKTKRKLEVPQTKPYMPGNAPPYFERMTRQRVIANVPPVGQYTRTDGRGCFAYVRPVYQDPTPVSYQNVGGVLFPVKPPPQRLHHHPLPPPYENSQILRVNRHVSIKMPSDEGRHSLQTTLSKPMMQGTFKYRSVSVSPLRPKSGGPSHKFQQLASDKSLVNPESCAEAINHVPPRDHHDDDNFDLDSLRTAALQSKINRNTTTTTLTNLATPEEPSASSMSPSPILKLTNEKETKLKLTSPSSENELRLEILRSMKRKRKQASKNLQNDTQVSMPPASSHNMCKMPEMISERANRAAAVENSNDENAKLAPPADQSVVKPFEPMVLKQNDGVTDRMTNEQSTIKDKICESDNPESFIVRASKSANATADEALKIPEFRPLTASTQSVVIYLSSEDYLPRQGIDDTRTNGTSLQNAIKDMRQKIAEREQEQTNRLLANARLRLFSPSSSETPSLPSSVQWLSSDEKVSTVVAPLSGDTASSEVGSSAFEIEEKQLMGAQTEGFQVEKASSEAHVQTAMSEENLRVETARKRTQEHDDVSRCGRNGAQTSKISLRSLKPVAAAKRLVQASSMAMRTDILQTEDSTRVPILGKLAIDTSIADSGKRDIDFDVIRIEYEQCVAECEEAYLHIVRLSNEITRLERQLLRAESIVGRS